MVISSAASPATSRRDERRDRAGVRNPNEFANVRWWPITNVQHVPATRSDPYLPRSLAKFSQ